MRQKTCGSVTCRKRGVHSAGQIGTAHKRRGHYGLKAYFLGPCGKLVILGRFQITLHWHMEEYLYGVVPYEMPATFPPEALKAQAVMARTYALNHLGEHAKYGYDLCDGQHCQVYGGVTAEAKSARDAVDATRSLVVKYNGRPVSAVFSSNSGGFTQDGKNAGWNDMPYWHDDGNFAADRGQILFSAEIGYGDEAFLLLANVNQNVFLRYLNNLNLDNLAAENLFAEIVLLGKKPFHRNILGHFLRFRSGCGNLLFVCVS